MCENNKGFILFRKGVSSVYAFLQGIPETFYDFFSSFWAPWKSAMDLFIFFQERRK